MFFPSCPFDQPAACPSCRPTLPCRGSPSAIHEVLILLSRLWADSAYGKLYHSRGFDLVLGIYEVLISPISRRRAFTRPMSLRQPIYEVLISFIVLFSAWSLRFLFIGKLCKALLLFTAFCKFQPLSCRAAPFFLPLFRQKATFFVETAQSDSQYLVAFLWKWITFGVRLRPLQCPPIYEVLISFWGFRASVRDTNLVNQLPASRQQRDQSLVHWSRPKADWVRSRPRK